MKGTYIASLTAFVAESNRIEGILRPPTEAEVEVHRQFASLKTVTVEDVVTLVAVCQPNAALRDAINIPGVRVGNHIAPPSGSLLMAGFMDLLARIDIGTVSPWKAHVEYETLHPFTDGNGRSGRAIWMWHMRRRGELKGALKLGFLHSFYYQTLAASH